MRRVGDPATPHFDLIVADSGGGNLRVLATSLDTDNPYEWSPDGSYLIFTDSEFRVLRIDANEAGQPKQILDDGYVQPGEFRPPDGRQILYEPQKVTGNQLWVMNSDGSGRRLLVDVPPARSRDGTFGSVRYSPDGTKIAFLEAPAQDTKQLRIFVMNADGTGVHPLTTETGSWVETDLAWSPDSKRIAFDRWHFNEAIRDWDIQPIGIAGLEDGIVRSLGPVPVSGGAWFAFSPDGTALVSIPATPLADSYPSTNVQPTVIDVSTGEARPQDWQVGSMLTWQRLAQ
jgi:dipeptidyl aminopeptidase/acylaminoacyl peptidase